MTEQNIRLLWDEEIDALIVDTSVRFLEHLKTLHAENPDAYLDTLVYTVQSHLQEEGVNAELPTQLRELPQEENDLVWESAEDVTDEHLVEEPVEEEPLPEELVEEADDVDAYGDDSLELDFAPESEEVVEEEPVNDDTDAEKLDENGETEEEAQKRREDDAAYEEYQRLNSNSRKPRRPSTREILAHVKNIDKS